MADRSGRKIQIKSCGLNKGYKKAERKGGLWTKKKEKHGQGCGQPSVLDSQIDEVSAGKSE